MPLVVTTHGHTDLGCVRKVNEDSFAVDDARGIAIVADGMGGHTSGEVASKTAVAAVLEELTAHKSPIDVTMIEKAIQHACARVFQLGQKDDKKRGMGTTIDVVVRSGDRALLGHVGDGRVYLLRGGQTYRLTKDHTIVAAQVEAGILTPQEAEESTLRGVLTRALGTHQSVQVDTLSFDLVAGDVLLLCTDGMHRYLRDDEVASRVREATPAAVKQLIEHAKAAGGEDNICAVLMGCIAGEIESARDPKRVTSRIDAVRSLPLFQHLSYKEQVSVLSIAHNRVAEAGSVIVKQGDPGQEMFIIVDGDVIVERDGITIAELGAGGHFGEMSIVDDAPRSASVKARTRADLLVIGQAEIGGLMRLDPVLAVKILWTLVQALSGRLRLASAELIEFKQEEPRRQSNVQMPFVK
jgi:PPM family protein phosphatase